MSGTEVYKILLVDDEPDILEFISYNLNREGYTVFTASNGVEGLKKAREVMPHLIILDVMMPEMDGIEMCSEIRKIPELKKVMVAMLTARSEDYTQIAGFDAGADDYINKPIKPKVLLSRVKALLRRLEVNESGPVLEAGELKIDREKYTVARSGTLLVLPRKEFELLALLASKPGKVFTRDEILQRVWGDEVIVGDRTIDVHVRKVREKLGEDYIRTVKGVGYKFEF
ncbi:MAG: response regulator transcription factor [Bacteroidia bacterium]|nr:response regulator transcription factor [Bacteroidia bacterium]